MSVSILALPLLLAGAPAEAGALPATAPAPVVTMPEQAPSESAPVPPGNAAPPPPAQAEPAPHDEPPPENTIVVTRRAPSPADPAEAINVVSYQAVQALDRAIVGPIAHTYKHTIPGPVRDGLHNVLNNLDEPIVFVNFLLQLKPGKALETLGRFTVNTTLGIGGLFDVAKKKPFNLPRRSNGLADTLGYYGVGPGPYLFLPVIGATTLRDLLARPFDFTILPTAVPKPFADSGFALGKGVLSALDERAQNDDKIEGTRQSADPYAAQREEYLARRRAEIDVLKGRRKTVDGPLIDKEAAPSTHPEPKSPVEAPANPATIPETVGTP